MPSHLVAPHGGELVNLRVEPQRAAELKAQSRDWPSWDLSPRQLCDLELLMVGGFSPLEGFMVRRDYDSVCQEMHLADGTLWAMPVTLDVGEELAAKLGPGDRLALRDPEGVMLAVLTVEEVWQPDLAREAQQVYGSTSREHPGVRYLCEQTRPWYVGGHIEGIQPPHHYDFVDLRMTPVELRARFTSLGWRRVVAFQTRNPMHRAHYELTCRASRELGASLLLHPVVGMTRPGDIDHFTRVRCYQALLRHYPHNTAMLSLLPLAMRMAGPREALWHAIIRQNYGASHFIVGRDHAGPGNGSGGETFYEPYEAQALLEAHRDELAIEPIPFQEMVYLAERDAYVPLDEVPPGAVPQRLSGTDFRDRLARGSAVPEWFSFPDVIDELRRSHPPRHKQGFTVFFTGLPSAGKSTVANALMVRLLESGGRPVSLLDGDIVRKHLSSELGFSREHRDINIRRIGFVASEITKNGGIAVCAPIAPYRSVRNEVREMIEPLGGYILVHVSTPVAVCEQRDRKGLYAKAREGIIKEFTGVSDPYEEPLDADIVMDTTELSPEESVQQVLLHLEKQGYLGPPD